METNLLYLSKPSTHSNAHNSGHEDVATTLSTSRVHEITLKESRFRSDDQPAIDFGEAVPFFEVEQGIVCEGPPTHRTRCDGC
jgi:hypothetical protein